MEGDYGGQGIFLKCWLQVGYGSQGLIAQQPVRNLYLNMEICQDEKVEYIPYTALPAPADPSLPTDSFVNPIYTKFQSKDWKRHFQATTQLRSLNKHLPEAFITHIFPLLFKQVIAQVDNLRSNNSKQSLTLLTQVIRHNQLTTLTDQELSVLVNRLFVKSCSEKGFLRQEAREAIAGLEEKQHPRLLIELSLQTQAANYQISELAVVTLKNCLLKKAVSKENMVFPEFLRILAKNIHGKRALIEKTSKEILAILDKTYTTEGLTAIVGSSGIPQDGKDALTTQIGNLKKGGPVKPKGSLKDFLKAKKQNSQKMQVQ